MSNEKVEADHLRWIVEKQPACLMRVATDGPVLAANDAALALLGAEKPSQVLGKALTGFLVPLSQEPWQGFIGKLTAGAAHSLECDLLDVSGMVRSVILHGVPLAEHADGIPSVLLAARDVGAVRRVEAALHESEQLRHQVASESQSRDDDQQVEALRATIAQLESDRAQLERVASELPRLQQLLKQGRVYLQDLQTKLADATKEREALARQLSERDTEQQSRADREAAHAATNETYQLDLGALRAELEDSTAAREDLSKRVAALDEQCTQLRQEKDDVSQRLTAHEERVRLLEERLEQSQRDRDDIADQLSRRTREHEDARALAEHHQLATEQTRRDLESIEDQRRVSAVENARLAERILELTASEQQLAADRESLQRAEERIRDFEERLQQSQRDRDDLAQQLSQRAREHEDARALAEHHQHASEQTRSDLEQVAAERDSLQRSIAEERSGVAALREELARAMADSDRVSMELGESESARARQAQEHEGHRTQLEGDMATATAQLREAEKTLSDQRLELQSMDVAVRQIEPFAAAGRVSVDLAQELLATIADIDARTACLLAECATEASARHQIEQLRSDAVKAGSVARQITHANRAAQPEERASC